MQPHHSSEGDKTSVPACHHNVRRGRLTYQITSGRTYGAFLVFKFHFYKQTTPLGLHSFVSGRF